jgi:hypothetical protein
MSKTNNKENKENNEHEVYSVPYTKAGLANKNSESDDKSENEGAEQKSSDSTEHTPKISKEKSTERDRERPIH